MLRLLVNDADFILVVFGVFVIDDIDDIDDVIVVVF